MKTLTFVIDQIVFVLVFESFKNFDHVAKFS